MELSTLTEDLVPLSIKFNGSTLKLKYRLGSVNEEFFAWAAEKDPSGKLVNTNIDVVERLVAEWDLKADGEPVPLDAEHLRSLNIPSSFFKAIGDAIIDDSSPKSMTAKPLRGSSGRKGGSGRS